MHDEILERARQLVKESKEMEILELSPERLKEIKEKFKKSPANLSMTENLNLKMQNAIDYISYQVTHNGENFTFIYNEWLKESTSLGQKYKDHVKDQCIKKINAYDAGFKMYRTGGE